MQVVAPPDPRARVGFIVPRWIEPPTGSGPGLPFRSIVVAGALYSAGFELAFFDQEPDDRDPDRVAAFLDAIRGTPVVFFWMNDLSPSVQLLNTARLAAVVKEHHPSTRIVVGGPFITLCPPEVLRPEWPVDFFVRGYGEQACVELCSALLNGGSLAPVPGLVWRRNGTCEANPTAAKTPFRPEYLSLYRVLDLDHYKQRGGIFGNGFATMTIGTGQGCAKPCQFCYWRGNPPSLARPEPIVELASWLHRSYGVRQFHLAELDFFTNRRRALTFAREWKRRVPECRWFSLASPVDADRFTDAEWDLLAAGGCAKLELGTETGSARMLRRLGKTHDVDAPLRVTRRAVARGIQTMHNFIFGVAGETEADRRASLRLIRGLQHLDPERVYFAFRLFQPCWGTALGESAIAALEAFPRSLEEVPPYRARFADPHSHTLAWLTDEEDRRVKRLVFHDLPMVTSRLAFDSSFERWAFRALRLAARARLRVGNFDLGLDRWLYRRLIRRSLDNTYAP